MKSKCDISKCHAACCYNVPMEKGYLSAFKKKIVNPVIELGQWEDVDRKTYKKTKIGELGRAHYLMITDKDPAKNKCPFLRNDCKCNIYQDRPIICRRYGQTDNVRFLHCNYLQGELGAPTRQEAEAAIFQTIHEFLPELGI